MIQTPRLVQLLDIVSNFVFHSNHCDANIAFIKFRESADQHGCRAKRGRLLNAKFAFKGSSPTNRFCTNKYANTCLQLCR